MPKQTGGASAGTAREVARTPPLPDLTDVDLRTLRELDVPVLAAAVAHVLRAPGQLAEMWGSEGGTGGNGGSGGKKEDQEGHARPPR